MPYPADQQQHDDHHDVRDGIGYRAIEDDGSDRIEAPEEEAGNENASYTPDTCQDHQHQGLDQHQIPHVRRQHQIRSHQTAGESRHAAPYSTGKRRDSVHVDAAQSRSLDIL